MFTPVCHSVHMGVPGLGGEWSGGAWSWGVPGPGECLVLGGAWWRPPHRTATAVGGTHPTGMHSCSQCYVH